MSILDKVAHVLVTLIGAFARAFLAVLDFVDNVLRDMMHDAGLGGEMQTVLVIFIVTMFLVGAAQLLRGRIRTGVALLFVLLLMHTLEHIAHGPVLG